MPVKERGNPIAVPVYVDDLARLGDRIDGRKIDLGAVRLPPQLAALLPIGYALVPVDRIVPAQPVIQSHLFQRYRSAESDRSAVDLNVDIVGGFGSRVKARHPIPEFFQIFRKRVKHRSSLRIP